MRPEIIVCSTCRFSDEDRDDPAGVRGGQRVYEALRLAAQAARFAGLEVSQVECLWACLQHCTINLRAPGKCSYVAGRFASDGREAEAILEFALAYAESPDGSVPYRLWPEQVKGHFIARLPASRPSVEPMS